MKQETKIIQHLKNIEAYTKLLAWADQEKAKVQIKNKEGHE